MNRSLATRPQPVFSPARVGVLLALLIVTLLYLHAVMGNVTPHGRDLRAWNAACVQRVVPCVSGSTLPAVP